MKKKIFSTLVFVLALGLSVTSCGGSDDGPAATTGGNRVVKYKAFTSDNALNSTVIHTNAQGDPQLNSAVNATTWESPEINMPSSVPAVTFGANGHVVTCGQTGTLTVQIIVNGTVVKENVSTGEALSSTTSH